MGQKAVQDGLISLFPQSVLMLSPMAPSQDSGNTEAAAELVTVAVSGLRLDTGGGFHQALGQEVGKSQGQKYTRMEDDEAVSDCCESSGLVEGPLRMDQDWIWNT